MGAVVALAACSKSAPTPPARVEVVTIALATVVPASGSGTLGITGTVRLKRETQLGFSTAGRVAAINVLEGDRVGAGRLLARLDPTGLDAANQSARADAVRADADYQRMRALLGKGWVTRTRLESAEAVAAAARAKLVQTGFDERLGRIVAPAAGVVLRRAVEPGQIVAAGAPVLTVGEIGSGYVLRLPVSDSDLVGIRTGQRAAVILPALSPNPITATVGEIGARGDDRTGTFQVELRLPAVPGMRSGLIGSARLVTGAATPGGPVAVPASAVFAARADEGFVYVYRPATGTVAARLVKLGSLDDAGVTVTSGLQPGEQVARSGIDRLRDGIKVAVAR
ncbi:efflux RND transporter periplasmic adaptor subunit [Sphingosinicellaceae bacterium]|nr:efflux RND transporter periplasmic adaptor subunit [Sphingosinicellaceae bacterium]